MITSNLGLVIKSVNTFEKNLDVRSRMARDEMAMKLLQLAKEEIRTGGGAAQAGGPPVSRTGRLRGSIHVEKSTQGFAKYSALIGPGVIYGRVLEMGFSNGNKYPYMTPAFNKFKTVYAGIIRKHVLTGSL